MNNFQNALDKLEFEKVRQRIMWYASSEPGRDELRSFSISISLDDVKLKLMHVSELKRLFEEEAGLPLEGIYPVREATQKASIEGTVLQPKELAQILSTLRSARTVRQFLAKRHEQYPKIWDITQNLYTDKVLEYNLGQAIDDTGIIRANASRELQSIRRAIADKYEQLKKRLEKAAPRRPFAKALHQPGRVVIIAELKQDGRIEKTGRGLKEN